MGEGTHGAPQGGDGWRSRKVAAELVLTLLSQLKTLDEILAEHKGFDALTGPDRGFARAMVSATLRQLGRIDAFLSTRVDQPIGELQAPVLNLLRIGATQTLILETADHAAVGQTVDAAQHWPQIERSASLINAVLRRVVREKSSFTNIDPMTIWPSWLQTRLASGLGVEAATELARAQLQTPPLDITSPTDAITLKDPLSARHISVDTLRRTMAGSVEDLPAYADGTWWVQDVAAALPAHLLAPQPGEHVADLCAAPGGKTLQLCAAGSDVTALDRSGPRLRVLARNLERTGFTATVKKADAETWRPEAPFDRILLDAPCSALGTLRRHPEGAHIKAPADISRFPSVQLRLLMAAAEMIKPGGTLVYCVCSPLPEEGEEVIARGLASGRWARQPIRNDEVSGFEAAITEAGDLRTLPHLFDDPEGCDAFFIARLTRLS